MGISWWENSQIPDVFRLDQGCRVVGFCGAGGKTSSIELLAAQIKNQGRTAILSTTTNVYSQNTSIYIPNVIRETFFEEIEKIKFTIRFYDEINALGKLKQTHLSEYVECIKNHNSYWLVEVDGARHGWLKAPLDGEPCWPSKIDLAVGCFSANVLGSHFFRESNNDKGYGGIHRPERFSELTGISEGDPIDIEKLAQLINHPLGMFRGLAATCQRVVLATEVRKEQVWLLKALSERINCHLILRAHGSAGANPVQIKPYPLNLVAAILAGGKGSRMETGENKLFLPLTSEKNLLEASLELPLMLKEEGTIKDLVIISGHEEAFQTALKWQTSFVENKMAHLGLSQGLKRLGRYGGDPSIDAVFIWMGDQPLVSRALIKTLIEALMANETVVAAIPTYKGIRMSPVLIRRSFLSMFEALEGDVGAKGILAGAECINCPWEEEADFKDADTLEDLEWIKTWMRRAEGV